MLPLVTQVPSTLANSGCRQVPKFSCSFPNADGSTAFARSLDQLPYKNEKHLPKSDQVRLSVEQQDF